MTLHFSKHITILQWRYSFVDAHFAATVTISAGKEFVDRATKRSGLACWKLTSWTGSPNRSTILVFRWEVTASPFASKIGLGRFQRITVHVQCCSLLSFIRPLLVDLLVRPLEGLPSQG